ncbi:MAG TPA: carbon-nitrogen hydrolase family protein [Trebonia sp.]|nr:carbon-nitrogen hydrolase family protein [Trebonia sp.]
MIRVAAWQCRPGPLDVEGNLRRLDEACAAAAAQQAAVLVTPEMFVSGYGIAPAEARRLAEEPGGPTEAAVARIARRHRIAIGYGYPERAGSGRPYNAATLIGPDGAVRGRHRKVHLYGDADRSRFTAGPRPAAAFDFDGSRIGMLICYDVEFPEAVRGLAVGGARAVLVPTANMAGFQEVQQFVVRSRAYENGCGVVYANYCGADSQFEYGGLSVICGPGGELLAQAGPRDEQLLVADLTGESAATYLADRRPELYGS